MIAYHGTPTGGTRIDSARFLKGRHALVSYANPSDISIVAECCSSFVLDNGAFTFWKGGTEPDWDKYAEWVSVWSKHPGYDWSILPDVIDGTEDDNWLLQMEYRKIPLGVGVYHMHESFEHLERMIARYPRIAIGSSGQWSNPGTQAWWRRMNEIMNVICVDGVPQCKIHGLRMLDPLIFSRLPLSSADSCNACINSGSLSRFGIYVPPTMAQRAEVIASRIENHNSAAIWENDKQAEFSLCNPTPRN
jgi:hypothetical protein